MPLWGKFRVAFESWRMSSLDNHTIEDSGEIEDPFVEYRNWKPLNGSVTKKLRLAFVDGVRRTEKALYLEDPEKGVMVEGAFVSVGAGAIVLTLGELSTLEEALREVRVKRYFLVREGIEVGQPHLKFITKAGKLEFEVVKSPTELSPYVNELMASLEEEVAYSLHGGNQPVDLIVSDGPVRSVARKGNIPLVGYVKKHKRLYVLPEHVKILSEMRVGQRTPIVLVRSSEESRVQKFVWYLKLSEGEGLTSIARLEVPARVGLRDAVRIADLTTTIIPRFASSEFNDRRAPQNLIPIKYLENFLRRQLGSQTLIRRLIAEFIGS